MTVAVVTDSTSDLDAERLTSLGVSIAPLMVTIDGRTYRDQLDISPADYLTLLGSAQVLPHTAAPSPGVMADCYRQALASGASAVVAIHLSGELSATIRAAHAAQAMVGEQVEVVDSMSTSLGLGMLVWWAALSARSGSSAEEVAAEVRSLAARIAFGFTPMTLEYLARGGRIGEAARWLGALLDMKPVLEFEGGRVRTYRKVRGSRPLVPSIVQLLSHKAEPGSPVLAAGFHAGNAEEVARLKNIIDATWNVVGWLDAMCGPVLATHGGPGAFGAAMIPLNSNEVARWRRWTDV